MPTAVKETISDSAVPLMSDAAYISATMEAHADTVSMAEIGYERGMRGRVSSDSSVYVFFVNAKIPAVHAAMNAQTETMSCAGDD